MWSRLFVISILAATSLLSTSCANGLDAAARVLFGTSEGLTSRLEISPASSKLGVGTTYPLTAVLIAESGKRTDVTTSATWVSSNGSIATINGSGRLNGQARGTLQVSAAAEGLSGTANVSVLGFANTAIVISAPDTSLPRGATEQLTATVTLEDGTTQDVTTQVQYSTGTGNLTVSPSGVATGNDLVGSTPVTAVATLGGVPFSSGNAGGQSPSITVTPAVLRHIQLTPASVTVTDTSTQQFTATGVYSDGTTINETNSATWSSSNTGVATINTTGLATGVAAGTTTISAVKSGISSSTSPGNSAALTVKSIVSIAVTSSTGNTSPSTPKGITHQFIATATYSDGSTTVVTSQVTWTSSDTGVANNMNGVGSEGLASTVGVGTTTITATLGAITSSGITLTVTPATLVSIAVTPATPSVAVGAQQQFVATGTYTDSTTQTITNTVTWSSTSTGVATISGTGLATVVGAGSTTIQAVLSGKTGSTVLTGNSVTLNSIAITPTNPTLSSIGATQQFSATATYSDASNSDITSTCAWSSSATSVATISNAGGTEGRATTVATGTSNITCTKSSVTSNTAVITVNGDTTAPTIANVVKVDNTHIKVTFAEGMKVGANEADDVVSYKIATTVSGTCSDNSNFTGSSQTGDFSITSVSAGNNDTEFTLTLSGSLGNKNYYLLADKSKLEDKSTNALTCSNAKSFYGLDSEGAYLVSASQDGTVVTVTFSEDVQNGGGTVNDADNASNYALARIDGTCNIPTVSSITKVDERTFKLNLNATITGSCNFTVTAATTIKDKAVPTANTMGSPNALTFKSNQQLFMERGEAVAGTVTQMKVIFSKQVKSSSATCSDSTTCATMYKIVPSLGNITSAVVQADGRSVVLTHASNQKGMFYVVLAANAVNSDGFDNGSSIRNLSDTENVQASPFDRFAVLGNGEAINSFASGEYFNDPFGDFSKFVFVFTYGNNVYVGPNDKNNATFRFLPSGLNPSLGSFSFASPTCATYKGFGFVDTANSKDLTTTPDCAGGTSGPIQEIGVVGFNQVRLNISSTVYEMLIVGPLAVNIATQGRVWYTQDLDNLLDMKQTTVTGTNGVNSKSLQTIYGFDDLVFVGISSNHGTNAPVLNRLSATASSGVVTLSASPFDLGANGIDILGKSTGPGETENPAKAAWSTSTVGVDSMLKTAFASTNILYVANNGGVVYMTDNSTSGYRASSANSIVVTNATPSTLSGTTLVLGEFSGSGTIINATTGGGLGKIRPGERGYHSMLTYNNKVYMVRNVARSSTCTTPGGTTGTEATDCFMSRQLRGEVWKCDPGVDGICQTTEWTRIVAGTETSGGSDSTNVPTRNSIGMLTANGNNLYVGFDSYDGDSKGMRVFKIASTDPPATNGSTMASAGWTSAGTNGFGLGDANKYIFGASSAQNGTENVIFIVVGDGINPVKVYRQVD